MSPRHSEYILTPLAEVMTEASHALSNVGKGFGSYPLKEYFLRALFLKMTGAQEQKCKCICWDIATYDYTYRYETFSNWSLGECSRLADKNSVANSLLRRVSDDYELVDLQKQNIINGVNLKLKDFYDRCSILGWPKYEFTEFVKLYSNMTPSCLLIKNSNSGKNVSWEILRGQCEGCPNAKSKKKPNACTSKLRKGWSDIYLRAVYVHRNECAHNTLSCQMNRPTFGELTSYEMCYNNYYLRFAILSIIDEILMALYKEWLKNVSGNRIFT